MLIEQIGAWIKSKIGGEGASTQIPQRGKTYNLTYAKPRTGYDSKYAMATVYISTEDNAVSLKLNIFVNLGDDVQLTDYNDLDDVVPQSKTLDEALIDMRVLITLGEFKVFSDLLIS